MSFVFENKSDLTMVNGLQAYKIKIDLGVSFFYIASLCIMTIGTI